MIIHFCNNDDNGNFTSELIAIRFGECLELRAIDYDGYICDISRDSQNKTMTLGEARFNYQQYKVWYGSIVWNAVTVDLHTANEMVNHLRLNYYQKIEVEAGDVESCFQWEFNLPIYFGLEESHSLGP